MSFEFIIYTKQNERLPPAVSKGRIYDNTLENSETGIEFYTPNPSAFTDIRNNVFQNNRFGILAASHYKPTDIGSSGLNNLTDSVYLRVFCNDFTNHYLAFGGVGKFPIFEGKKQAPNYMATYKAANYFYNCYNAFFIRSNINIKYNYNFNFAIEEPTANNMATAANLYLHDTLYFNLTDKSVNNIDTVNVNMEFCGSGMQPFQLINHSIDEKVFAYLMPNPVIDYLYLNTNITTGDLIIHNIGGRLLDKFKVRRGQNTINLSNYPSGVYIFTLINQYEHISLGKIVKCNE
jgi:hypothetical protein